MATMSSPDSEFDRPPRSFEDFYRTSAQWTFGVAMRMARGDRNVAKDATQDAYEQMLRCWTEWINRSIREAARYATKIAVRKVIDRYRRQRDVALPDNYDLAHHDVGYDNVLSQPLFESVIDLIYRQPTRRRAVAVLFFVEEFTYAEIAETLGITESTARTHVERMRVLMRPLVNMGRRGGGRGRP